MVSYRVIGQPTPRTDVQGKVTGEAHYTPDVQLPGMLWAKALRSPLPHARIVRIDTSKAEALPGVRCVVTGADTSGMLYGRGMLDVAVLADGRVRFIGERVAAVAADDLHTAEAAVALIDVEYEELPAVLDPDEAIREGAPIIHPDMSSYVGLPDPAAAPSNVFVHDLSEKGDVEAGFAASDVIVENEFSVSRVHAAYMEPHCCVAWKDDDGKLQVWAPNKAPHGLKQILARALSLNVEEVVVNPVMVGGDFGAKGAALDEPLCCFLALRSGRPVKMGMDYVEELTASSTRHAGVLRLKTGVMRDGTLVAHQLDAVFDSGAYGGLRPRPSLGSAGHGAGLYKIPNARLEVRRVYTNNIPGGQMRAPAEPQGVFAAESHIDCVARAIGMDPLEFRLHNLIEEGDETVAGDHYRDVRARETLEAAAEGANYASPTPAGVGRGIAMGYRSPGGGESAIAVSLNQDGSVVIGTPVFDQGTGTYTTLRQVVSEELRYPAEEIAIEVLDTDHTAFDSGIGGSRGTHITTGSAYQAASEAREELARLVSEALEWPEDEIELDGRDAVRRTTGERRPWGDVLERVGRSVRAEAVYKNTEQAPVTGFTAQIAEVSVDPETGEVKLLRFTTAHDVGTVLNPIGHQGQINGGVMQGIGYGLLEEVQVEDGRVLTPNLSDFKIPTIQDIPDLVTVLLEPHGGVGPYNIKGIGENPVVPVAAAIANAVEDASGARVRDLPVTAERVRDALRKG